MKAQVALITIGGESVLKVLLVPEDDQELSFLNDALEKCEGYKLSAADRIPEVNE